MRKQLFKVMHARQMVSKWAKYVMLAACVGMLLGINSVSYAGVAEQLDNNIGIGDKIETTMDAQLNVGNLTMAGTYCSAEWYKDANHDGTTPTVYDSCTIGHGASCAVNAITKYNNREQAKESTDPTRYQEFKDGTITVVGLKDLTVKNIVSVDSSSLNYTGYIKPDYYVNVDNGIATISDYNSEYYDTESGKYITTKLASVTKESVSKKIYEDDNEEIAFYDNNGNLTTGFASKIVYTESGIKTYEYLLQKEDGSTVTSFDQVAKCEVIRYNEDGTISDQDTYDVTSQEAKAWFSNTVEVPDYSDIKTFTDASPYTGEDKATVFGQALVNAKVTVEDQYASATVVKKDLNILATAIDNKENKLVAGNGIKLDAIQVPDGEGGYVDRTKVAIDTEVVATKDNLREETNRAQAVENQLNNRISDTNNRLDKVGAGAAAMASIAYQPMRPGESQVAMGVGNYKGQNAISAGLAYQLNNRLMINAKVAAGNGENMVGMGLSYRFGGHDVRAVAEKPVPGQMTLEQVEMLAVNKELTYKVQRQDERIAKLEALVAQLAAK